MGEIYETNDINALEEGLTLVNLAKNAGLSSFTKNFKKERNKIMGLESSVARIKDIIIHPPGTSKRFPNENYIQIEFRTPSTDKYGPHYVRKEVDINTLRLKKDPDKKYSLYIRIMNFFDWLETAPDKNAVTRKDIKDILKNADVKVFSSDPSFQFQGMNYNMTQLDAAIHPEHRPPKVWNKKHGDGNAFLSKHLQGIVNNIEFWYNVIAQTLNSKLRQMGYLPLLKGKKVQSKPNKAPAKSGTPATSETPSSGGTTPKTPQIPLTPLVKKDIPKPVAVTQPQQKGAISVKGEDNPEGTGVVVPVDTKAQDKAEDKTKSSSKKDKTDTEKADTDKEEAEKAEQDAKEAKEKAEQEAKDAKEAKEKAEKEAKEAEKKAKEAEKKAKEAEKSSSKTQESLSFLRKYYIQAQKGLLRK